MREKHRGVPMVVSLALELNSGLMIRTILVVELKKRAQNSIFTVDIVSVVYDCINITTFFHMHT